MLLDFDSIDSSKRYKIMSNSIFPRPVAWITTQDNSIINLAPFSYFTPISSQPPLVVVSIGKKSDGSYKDTLANIFEHKVCTINLANKEFLLPLQQSAEELPKNISECERFGIKTKEIVDGFPPMVEGIGCALFCEFYQKVEIPSETTPVILQIKKNYIDDAYIDAKQHIHLENIGRVGLEFLVDAKRIKSTS
jgi:flavin reductase (DIM6/NTAB) family NADH-FMN oxidoreductase RutF